MLVYQRAERSQSASHLIPFEHSKASSGADRRPIFDSLAPGFEYPVVHLIAFPHTLEVKNGHPFIKPQTIEHLEIRCFSGNWFPKPSEINLSNYEVPSPRWTSVISILCGFPGFKRRNNSSTHCCQLGFQVLQASDPSNAAPLSSTNGCLANLHQRIAPGFWGQKSHRNRYQVLPTTQNPEENITNIYKYDFFPSPFWTSRKILCSQRLLTKDLQRLSHSGRDSGRDFFGARFSLIFCHSCSQG